MANRTFNQFRHALEKKVVDLFATITFGASGAPTLTYNKGIKSITQANTGLYILKYEDSYYRLLEMHHSFLEDGVYATSDKNGAGGTAIPFPAAPACTVLKSGASSQGGFGIVKITTAVAGNTLTIAGVTFTAIANAGTPSGNQWAVGTGGDAAANAVSAAALAAAINAATDAALTAAGIKAYCILANVIIEATKKPFPMVRVGTPLALSAATSSGGPGIVLAFNSAGTAANPASGEVARVRLTLSDSTAL